MVVATGVIFAESLHALQSTAGHAAPRRASNALLLLRRDQHATPKFRKAHT